MHGHTNTKNKWNTIYPVFYTELVLVWGKTIMERTWEFDFGTIRSHGHASSEHTAQSKLLSWLAYRSMRTESTADSVFSPTPVVRKLNHSNSILAALCMCFADRFSNSICTCVPHCVLHATVNIPTFTSFTWYATNLPRLKRKGNELRLCSTHTSEHQNFYSLRKIFVF